MSRHVHLEVYGVGNFCMWRHGSWRPDGESQTLVIGWGVPRMHIPYVNIQGGWKVDDGPDWCRESDPEPESEVQTQAAASRSYVDPIDNQRFPRGRRVVSSAPIAAWIQEYKARFGVRS